MLKPKRQASLPTRGRAPALEISEHDGGLLLAASGSWTIREVAVIGRRVERLRLPARLRTGAPGKIDLSEVDHLDTAGAWLLQHIAREWRGLGLEPAFDGTTENQRLLLDEVAAQAAQPEIEAPRLNPFARLLDDIGAGLHQMLADAVVLTGFLGSVTDTLLRTLVKPWRFRAVSFVHHLEHTGLRAAPIISLVCLLIGAVILQQGAAQLRPYGAEPFAVNLLAILSLREVGILLTAVMLAGRSASAYTAEIGAMKMREEIDAMRALGIDPMETLVLPRILALMVALPLLTFLGDMMCLVGGGLVAYYELGLDTASYLERLQDVSIVKHFLVGLVKTPFVAIIIGLIGCVEGLRVRGSAESLGHQVTGAVVKAIFLVICVDGLFAMFIAAVGY